jgi:hypothetical protein
MEKLEVELAEIKTLLVERTGSVPAKKPGGVQFALSGYIKLDAAYDDSRVSVGNFARWAESERVRPDDDQFSMTANQTRLALQITAPDAGQLKTTGRIEVDFYGGGTAENKPEPLLRHAYLNANWSEWGVSLLAGQTSDVIAPLSAPTINYSAAWWQGNIGYRRPQLRLTQEFKFRDTGIKLEAAATRTITGRKFIYTDSNDPDTGSDSGFPTAQGRLSVATKLGENSRLTLGLSGHWGQEEQHLDSMGKDRTIDSWSVNVDATLMLTKWLSLQLEAFHGFNLDTYLGGIGQGYDTINAEGVEAVGGWVAVSLGPWHNWQFNIGAGCDNPYDGDMSVTTARTFNSVVFGNVWYSFSANLSLGYELSHLHTEYKDDENGNALRQQLAVLFKF